MKRSTKSTTLYGRGEAFGIPGEQVDGMDVLAVKAAGEKAVAAANKRAIILRTAWVYSPYCRNFIKTMLRLATERDVLSVVADQWGSPTSAFDIADGILHIAKDLNGNPPASGLYHLTGSGETNWAGLARQALETSRRLGGPHAEVKAIATVEYPTKARRPANSRLSTVKLTDAFGWKAPAWTESVERVVRASLFKI